MTVTYEIKQGEDGDILIIYEDDAPILMFKGIYGQGYGVIELIDELMWCAELEDESC